MKMQPTNFPSSTVLLLVSVKSIAANSVERPLRNQIDFRLRDYYLLNRLTVAGEPSFHQELPNWTVILLATHNHNKVTAFRQYH